MVGGHLDPGQAPVADPAVRARGRAGQTATGQTAPGGTDSGQTAAGQTATGWTGSGPVLSGWTSPETLGREGWRRGGLRCGPWI